MERILITRTIEGYADEVEKETNTFLAGFVVRNPEVKTLSLIHGPGYRVAQTIVVEADVAK